MKKWVKILLIVLLAVVLLAAAYVAYVFISYHRIGDQPLTPVQTPDTAPSLSAGEAFEDYFIEFDEPCTPELLIMSDSCFYTGEVRPVPTDAQNRLWLTHRMFDRDAWFFRNTAKGLTLRSVHGARRVHMAFPDMTYIGLWHRPFSEAPYVCLEPWSGSPGLDRPGVAALEDKPDMTVLPPCGIYRNTYTMTFA